MHSTSLIGQALGGAQGTKASPAQDASKSSSNTPKDRSFADHVEDTRPKSQTEEQLRLNQTEQNAAAGASEEHSSQTAGGSADASEAQTEGGGEKVAVEAAEPVDQKPTLSKFGTLHGGSEGKSDPAISASVAQTAGDMETSASTAGDKSSAVRDALPGASGSQRLDAGPTDAKLSPESMSAQKASVEVTAPADAEAAERRVQSEVLQGEGRRAKVEKSQPASAISQAQGRAAAEASAAAQVREQGKSGDSGGVTNGEVLRASSEKAAEGRGQGAAIPATTAGSTNGAATPASQTVFQMQMQNAEAGEKRQSRYRVRDGETQVAAAVAKASAAATGINAPNAVMASANAALSLAQTLQADTAKLSQSASLLADSLAGQTSLSAELPGLSQLLTEAVIQPGATHRVETPRMIATQLAEAFAAKGERNMEVSLNPEELGRVKMRVSTSEAGIVMTIQTERPETGDLMRRHINELAEEFRRMGFQDISFEFSSGDSGFGSQAEQSLADGSGSSVGIRGAETEMAPAEEVADKQMQDLRLGTTGVDMRV
jgi:flagellar hook-length control protein FliK